MYFMVVRADTVGQRYKSSGDYLPAIVEAETAQEALDEAFSRWSRDSVNYRPKTTRGYIVVPMSQAVVVQVRRRQEYDFICSPWSDAPEEVI